MVYAFYHLMHLRFQTLSHLRLQYHLTDKWSSSLPAILCACGCFDIIHNFNGVWLCLSPNSVPHICRASFHFLFSFHGYSFFRVSSASNPMSRYPSRVFVFIFDVLLGYTLHICISRIIRVNLFCCVYSHICTPFYIK